MTLEEVAYLIGLIEGLRRGGQRGQTVPRTAAGGAGCRTFDGCELAAGRSLGVTGSCRGSVTTGSSEIIECPVRRGARPLRSGTRM